MKLLSAELVILFLAIFLDVLSILCVGFILLFGVGVIVAKIIYFIGLATIGVWQFFQSGGKKSKNSGGRVQKFFRKQLKKLIIKAIPGVGDLIPMWTFIVYSELKNK